MTRMAHRLIGLTAQTMIHAGSGSADDVLDLPIQREAHNDWPCIYGSSMKGALRANAEAQGLDQALVRAVFGPDTANASTHAGSLLVSDARLLLLPVRSLTGHFRRVTCPAALKRLCRDLERLGLLATLPVAPEPAPGEALVAETSGGASDLYLEEFRFDETQYALDAWVSLLSQLCGEDYRAEIARQLTVVDDDSFRHLCRSAMPVLPHVRLDNESKTVVDGALWYEECLAPETVLYVCLATQPSRYEDLPLSADGLLEELVEAMFLRNAWLQVGGNETVGMGWFRVRLVDGSDA
ncbi:MAG: type III-B CRISPR module RAMP protein Cmr4 [Gammaproteobacteria bacterium]|nr:MAG: type III-B CRISPR module RAMP protein Cmr4 [Gammaproteobacteria bacterium]